MLDYIIYTDGGYSSSNNVGSAAYVILKSDGQTLLTQNSFVLRKETSQRAELKAILAAIDALPDRCCARVCTDCLAATLSLGRAPRRKNQPDVDLLMLYKQMVRRKKLLIEFQWVRSHCGARWQEHCDNLCTETLAAAENSRLMAGDAGGGSVGAGAGGRDASGAGGGSATAGGGSGAGGRVGGSGACGGSSLSH